MQSCSVLRVWQRSLDLGDRVYALVQRFPNYELYGMTNQLRRAVNSVHANIAEGSARATPVDYARFLNHAQGSLAEVCSFLHFAVRREYVTQQQIAPLVSEAESLGASLERLRQKVLLNGKRSEPPGAHRQ